MAELLKPPRKGSPIFRAAGLHAFIWRAVRKRDRIASVFFHKYEFVCVNNPEVRNKDNLCDFSMNFYKPVTKRINRGEASESNCFSSPLHPLSRYRSENPTVSVARVAPPRCCSFLFPEQWTPDPDEACALAEDLSGAVKPSASSHSGASRVAGETSAFALKAPEDVPAERGGGVRHTLPQSAEPEKDFGPEGPGPTSRTACDGRSAKLD